MFFFILSLAAAGSFFFKYHDLKSQKKQLTLNNLILKADLDVARLLINPHFIFNSLSVLQNFILSKDYVQANEYMIKFSKLIRKMLESNTDSITSIEKEMHLLKSYLEFKEANFEGKLNHSVECNAALVPAKTYIPVMMLQPFIETALWQERTKYPEGNAIEISFSPLKPSYVKCVITESGNGKKKVEASDLIKQRLELLNTIHQLNCTLTIEENPLGNGSVTTVLLPVIRR